MTQAHPKPSLAERIPPLMGLLLCGGHSRRMGADKATLTAGDQPQWKRAAAALAAVCDCVFLSLRAAQVMGMDSAGFPLLLDAASEGDGPLAALAQASRLHPEAAYFVLACDMPAFDAHAARALAQARARAHADAFAQAEALGQAGAAAAPAIAFRSPKHGDADPLCAIWEPAALASLRESTTTGCPRTFLNALHPHLVDPVHSAWLGNANTPQEWTALTQALSASQIAIPASASASAPALSSSSALSASPVPDPVPVNVRYFAILREDAGLGEEACVSHATTGAGLYEELRLRRSLSLPREALRLARGMEFCDWDEPLRAGETYAFIPPVAGG